MHCRVEKGYFIAALLANKAHITHSFKPGCSKKTVLEHIKIIMKNKLFTAICHMGLVLAASIFLNSCQPAAYHKAQVQDNSTDRMTVGTVQREIRVGMSGAEVAQALGSPNIVSTDEERREVWIYDKIATDQVYSTSRGGINALIFGFGGDIASGGSLGGSQSSGAVSTSQRTLTVIIKFDKVGKVRDFAYHTSQF